MSRSVAAWPCGSFPAARNARTFKTQFGQDCRISRHHMKYQHYEMHFRPHAHKTMKYLTKVGFTPVKMCLKLLLYCTDLGFCAKKSDQVLAARHGLKMTTFGTALHHAKQLSPQHFNTSKHSIRLSPCIPVVFFPVSLRRN